MMNENSIQIVKLKKESLGQLVGGYKYTETSGNGDVVTNPSTGQVMTVRCDTRYYDDTALVGRPSVKDYKGGIYVDINADTGCN